MSIQKRPIDPTADKAPPALSTAHISPVYYYYDFSPPSLDVYSVDLLCSKEQSMVSYFTSCPYEISDMGLPEKEKEFEGTEHRNHQIEQESATKKPFFRHPSGRSVPETRCYCIDCYLNLYKLWDGSENRDVIDEMLDSSEAFISRLEIEEFMAREDVQKKLEEVTALSKIEEELAQQIEWQTIVREYTKQMKNSQPQLICNSVFPDFLENDRNPRELKVMESSSEMVEDQNHQEEEEEEEEEEEGSTTAATSVEAASATTAAAAAALLLLFLVLFFVFI